MNVLRQTPVVSASLNLELYPSQPESSRVFYTRGERTLIKGKSCLNISLVMSSVRKLESLAKDKAYETPTLEHFKNVMKTLPDEDPNVAHEIELFVDEIDDDTTDSGRLIEKLYYVKKYHPSLYDSMIWFDPDQNPVVVNKRREHIIQDAEIEVGVLLQVIVRRIERRAAKQSVQREEALSDLLAKDKERLIQAMAVYPELNLQKYGATLKSWGGDDYPKFQAGLNNFMDFLEDILPERIPDDAYEIVVLFIKLHAPYDASKLATLYTHADEPGKRILSPIMAKETAGGFPENDQEEATAGRSMYVI